MDAQSIMEKLTCNSMECLSWIIVLLNILTIFYLAFCAWFKITKSVKLIGWIWSAVSLCGTVIILFMHTCIFTIISAVFTGLVIMAVLSVCFSDRFTKEEEKSSKKDSKAIKGYYVIFPTDDNKFLFKLFDTAKKELLVSNHKYMDLNAVKRAIAECRKNGVDMLFEDATTSWVKDVDYPKLVLQELCGKFFFNYEFSKTFTAMQSKKYKDVIEAVKMAKKAMNAILTNEIYIAKEVVDGSEAEDFVPEKIEVVATVAPEKAVIPTAEETEKEQRFDVSFYKVDKPTFDESMRKIDSKIRTIVNDIMTYVGTKEKVKEFCSTYAVRYKLKRYELVRLEFKKDQAICKIMTGSSELKQYSTETKSVEIKEKPVVITIDSAESFEAIKKLIDIAYDNTRDATK